MSETAKPRISANMTSRSLPDDAAESYLRQADPILAAIMNAVGTLPPRRVGEHFEALVQSIASQQLAKQAAISILARLRASLPNGEIDPAALLKLKKPELRSIGMSSAKASYLHRLAERVIAHDLQLQSISDLAEDQIRSLLMQEDGIGAWTVDMFLIFQLQFPDVFPTTDAAIKRAMIAAYELASPCEAQELITVSNKWRPYRSLACRYLYAFWDLRIARAPVGVAKSRVD